MDFGFLYESELLVELDATDLRVPSFPIPEPSVFVTLRIIFIGNVLRFWFFNLSLCGVEIVGDVTIDIFL